MVRSWFSTGSQALFVMKAKEIARTRNHLNGGMAKPLKFAACFTT
jgi:hypothetical protein